MIRNKTKNKIVCKEFFVREGLLGQVLGLMFSRSKNLVFRLKKKRKINLHNFFVFFPIDLVFLDDKKQVVEIKEGFKPWCLYVGKEKASYVLELQQGLVKKGHICVGDRLSF